MQQNWLTSGDRQRYIIPVVLLTNIYFYKLNCLRFAEANFPTRQNGRAASPSFHVRFWAARRWQGSSVQHAGQVLAGSPYLNWEPPEIVCTRRTRIRSELY